ncbi:MAG: winged helix DNA-binding domain-containing protein [Bacteroidota bacterium]
MGPIQAQDYESVLWAIGLRTGLSRQAIEKSVLQGKMIRTHLLRPTWHLVAADQIYELLALTAPNIKKSLQSRHTKLGLSDALVLKANVLIKKILLGGQQLTREEIKPHFLAAGYDLSENRFYHYLLRAGLEGVICGGVPAGKKQTYRLLAELQPPKARRSETEILQNLASCYFSSRGPARLKDFSWWAGLKQKAAKQALSLVAEQLQEYVLEGESYYASERDELRDDDRVYFLPAYDEFIIAYQDKTRLFQKAEHLSQVAKSGVFYPLIVHRGQIVGKWKAQAKEKVIRVEYQLFEKTSLSQAQLEAGIESYHHFMERPIELTNVK